MDALHGPRVVLEPVAERHVAGLLALHRHPDVRRWWRDPAEGWPLEDDDGVTCFAVLLHGDPAPRGFVQYGEEDDPDYRHASIDVFVDPEIHGQGYGREVVAVLAAHLIDDLGHHRVVIDPAAGNGPAIACYGAVGFEPVGFLRNYERGLDGTWHDGLLMDLLADDLIRP